LSLRNRILSLIFVITVLLVGLAVKSFRGFYISNRKTKLRFNLNLLLFIVSIVLLCLRENFYSLFVGWDGLGLTRYFLVIFYSNWKRVNSGSITIYRNRIGDIFFLLSLWGLRNLDLGFRPLWGKIVILLVLLFTLTKSAQFPFSSWLPSAMSAPTPISALVHRRTLVAAGVFIFWKFFELFPQNLVLGAFSLRLLTLLYSGRLSLLESDFKKIVALSTLNQLALLFIALSLNCRSLAYFHLNVHAFFKSMLFLRVGVILHSAYSRQDRRTITNLVSISPTPLLGLFLALINLRRTTLSSGFLRKEIVVENRILTNKQLTIVLTIRVMVCFTLLYTLRLLKISLSLIKLRLNYHSDSIKRQLRLVLLSILNRIWGLCFSKNFLFIYQTKVSYKRIKLIISFLILALLLKTFGYLFQEKLIIPFVRMFYLNLIVLNSLRFNKGVKLFSNLFEKPGIRWSSFGWALNLFPTSFYGKLNFSKTAYTLFIAILVLLVIF